MNTIIFDYVVFNFANGGMRAGTFRSTAIGTTNTFVFDETTTTDIGNTSGVTLQAVVTTYGAADKLTVEGVNADAYNYTLQYFVREFRA